MRPLLFPTACFALLITALAVPARASTITYSSTFDPADVLFNSSGGACSGTNFETATTDTVSGQLNGSCESLSYDHQLVGYSTPPNTLLGALLTLWFYDDADRSNPLSNGNKESVVISIDPSQLNSLYIGEVQLNNNAATTLWYNVLSQVLDDGTLSVRLSVGEQGFGQNDFFFGESQLDGEWSAVGSQSVPEPGSLLLVGSGLGAVAMRVRRRGAKRT